jgi:membrane protein YqaA with SNARE-associated domain
MLKILTVAGLATFEIYAAIPAGFAMGLSAWVIFFASVTGGIVGVFVSAFLGSRIEKFLNRFRKPKETPAKNGLIHQIWEKYGVIGLGMLGTFTLGAPLSIAVGVGLNVKMRKLVGWCCLGVLARCAAFTLLAHFGKQVFF